MKEAIKSKMDEHVKQILDKPAITNEDYALLDARLHSLGAEHKGIDSFSMLMLLALSQMFASGGDSNV